MQRNTGYFPTESLEPSGNRLFSRSALNEGDLFRGSLIINTKLLFRGKLCQLIYRALTEETVRHYERGTSSYRCASQCASDHKTNTDMRASPR